MERALRMCHACPGGRRPISLSCLLAASLWLQLGDACAVRAQGVHHAYGDPATVGTLRGTPRQQILQTRTVEQTERPLPHLIEAMPRIQEELEVIHHRNQLIVARSNIIRLSIADPSVIEVAQFSPNEISVIGRTRGSTTLTIWFENVREPLIYLVHVIRDPSEENQRRIDYGKLERKLGVLFPNSRVYLIPLSGKVIVKGQARDSAEAAKILEIIRGEFINQEGSLGGPQPGSAAAFQGFDAAGLEDLNRYDRVAGFIVNMLDVPGEYQVMLHVKVAELKREQLRQMGIDFNALINSGRHAIAATVGGLPSTITGVFENGEVNVLLNLLTSNGTGKILAEPTLTVISGHDASFLAGGEFPVPTIVGVDGVGAQQTTFRGFGTSLLVTPTVIDRDLVRMRIIPEFSELNAGNGNNGIQGLNTRRVRTVVELREGQTIALAGLMSHQTRTEITRIPFLSEIPYVGPKLFAAKRSTQDETELLILVTPEIVRPMDADEVPPPPGFYVTPPNDPELYKWAMTEGAPDERVYQLAPYGHGAGQGMEVGYRPFNPAPAAPIYSPEPSQPGVGGHSAPPVNGIPGPYGTPGGGRYGQPAYPQPGTYPQHAPGQQPGGYPGHSVPPAPGYEPGPGSPQMQPVPDPDLPRFAPPPGPAYPGNASQDSASNRSQRLPWLRSQSLQQSTSPVVPAGHTPNWGNSGNPGGQRGIPMARPR